MAVYVLGIVGIIAPTSFASREVSFSEHPQLDLTLGIQPGLSVIEFRLDQTIGLEENVDGATVPLPLGLVRDGSSVQFGRNPTTVSMLASNDTAEEKSCLGFRKEEKNQARVDLNFRARFSPQAKDGLYEYEVAGVRRLIIRFPSQLCCDIAPAGSPLSSFCRISSFDVKVHEGAVLSYSPQLSAKVVDNAFEVETSEICKTRDRSLEVLVARRFTAGPIAAIFLLLSTAIIETRPQIQAWLWSKRVIAGILGFVLIATVAWAYISWIHERTLNDFWDQYLALVLGALESIYLLLVAFGRLKPQDAPHGT